MPTHKTGTRNVSSPLQFSYIVATLIFLLFSSLVFSTDAERQQTKQKRYSARTETEGRSIATPTFVQPGRFEPPKPAPSLTGAPSAPSTYDPARLIAGHLLRRLGFGSTKKELKAAMKMGIANYVNDQLNPNSINDDKALGKLPKIPKDIYEDYDLLRGWFMRMVYSKRQLLEKMTLVWHEHFSVSNEKVSVGGFMHDHEELLRFHALGNFKNMLVDVTKDQAMLIWLDNNRNNGKAKDNNGNPIPPNENYAREFLQLFSVGTQLLNLDGTPILDNNGIPIPAYTETDVREVARALTGWVVPYPYKNNNTSFSTSRHDEGNKTIMGATLVGRIGTDGMHEVEDVVNILFQQRADTIAAFNSKILIQKLTTETPPSDYVLRVATAFRDSNFSIKEAVRAVFTDPMFVDPTVVRTQYKEPIEQYVGAVRALKGKSKGDAFIDWSFDAGQLIYYPPSVFSFYPPGEKGSLLNTAMVFERDEVADELVRGYDDTFFSANKLIKKYHLTTPDETVDLLSDLLLNAEISSDVRSEIINYMGGQVTETKVKGAVWLVLCSPDFQRN